MPRARLALHALEAAVLPAVAVAVARRARHVAEPLLAGAILAAAAGWCLARAEHAWPLAHEAAARPGGDQGGGWLRGGRRRCEAGGHAGAHDATGRLARHALDASDTARLPVATLKGMAFVCCLPRRLPPHV